jgi:hypothetical protein
LQENLLLPDLDHVARHGDDALDEILGRVFGKIEDNDVAALRAFALDDHGIGEGNLHAVGELGDQQVVADLQGLEHGSGGDLEGLDHKGTNEKRQNKRHDERFGVFFEHCLPTRVHVSTCLVRNLRVQLLLKGIYSSD